MSSSIKILTFFSMSPIFNGCNTFEGEPTTPEFVSLLLKLGSLFIIIQLIYRILTANVETLFGIRNVFFVFFTLCNVYFKFQDRIMLFNIKIVTYIYFSLPSDYFVDDAFLLDV